jgi:hypothetical protein
VSTAAERDTTAVLSEVTSAARLANGRPVVNLDLLWPDDLLSGMLTQVRAGHGLLVCFVLSAECWSARVLRGACLCTAAGGPPQRHALPGACRHMPHGLLVCSSAEGMEPAFAPLPDDLLSGMLTQVAAEPQLQAVFTQLFASRAGCEIYLRPPERYGMHEPLSQQAAAAAAGMISSDGPQGGGGGCGSAAVLWGQVAAAAGTDGAQGGSRDAAVLWGQVAEAVREQQETIIGLLAADGELLMSPDLLYEVHIGAGDRLVVLSEH